MSSDGPTTKKKKYPQAHQEYHHIDDSINDRAMMGGKLGLGMSPAQTNTFYPTTQMTTEDNDAEAYHNYVQALQEDDEDDTDAYSH